MIRNESGQAGVEYILIAVLTVVIATTIIDRMKSANMIPSFVDGPAELMQGMIESGTWKNPKQARDFHPSLLNRKVSMRVDEGVP